MASSQSLTPDELQRRIKAVIYLPCAIAPLSMAGSCLVLVSISRIRQGSQKSLRTYHRLLIGISSFDIISSTGLMLGPLPIPSSTNFDGAHGTVASCSFQGFLQTLGLASFAYSTMLMVQYVLVIRYKIRNETLQKHVEPILHGIPLLFYGSVAIAGLIKQVYNPAGPFSCWISSSPLGCDRNPSEIECERGGAISKFFRDYLLVIPLVIWTFLSLLLLMIITATVLQRYRQHKRRYGKSSSHLSRSATHNIQQVITQSVLYGLVLINTLIWRTTNTFFQWADQKYDFFGKHYWITCLGVIFFPLMGFFNFFVFIRPRYVDLRRRRKLGRWEALHTAIWHPSKQQSQHLSSQQQQQLQNNDQGSPPLWQMSGVMGDSEQQPQPSSQQVEEGKNEKQAVADNNEIVAANTAKTMLGSSKDLSVGAFASDLEHRHENDLAVELDMAISQDIPTG